MSPNKLAIRVAARYAKDIDEAKRVFVIHRLSEARKAFYSIKERLVGMATLLPELPLEGKDSVYQYVGDHILALPDELATLEESLNAVALAISEIEINKLKEILPKQLVEEFKGIRDVRMSPMPPSPKEEANDPW